MTCDSQTIFYNANAWSTRDVETQQVNYRKMLQALVNGAFRPVFYYNPDHLDQFVYTISISLLLPNSLECADTVKFAVQKKLKKDGGTRFDSETFNRKIF